MVWMLSKFTTQSVGTSSRSAVSSSSDTSSRRVRVERGDDDRPDSVGNRVAGEYEDGTVPSWRCREPDLTALHRPSPSSPPRAPNRR